MQSSPHLGCKMGCYSTPVVYAASSLPSGPFPLSAPSNATSLPTCTKLLSLSSWLPTDASLSQALLLVICLPRPYASALYQSSGKGEGFACRNQTSAAQGTQMDNQVVPHDFQRDLKCSWLPQAQDIKIGPAAYWDKLDPSPPDANDGKDHPRGT